MLKTCPTCGEPTENTYCPTHQPKKIEPSKNSRIRGYDHTWRKLSQRARRLQPFCTHCGTTHDLTTDHTPEAWARKDQGLPIRLEDVVVLCRSCNSKAGAARGENTRGVDPKRRKGNPAGEGNDTITLENVSQEVA